MKSLCPHPDVCGSCGWSHIPYEKQLKQKLSDINGSFALKKLDVRVEDIFASPKTEHYRNRMDFVIDFEGRVGLREKGKWWRVIDGHPCFLADENIEEAFWRVREWVKESDLSFYDRKANTGFLRYAVIRSTLDGQVLVNIVTSAPRDEAEVQRVTASTNMTPPPLDKLGAPPHFVGRRPPLREPEGVGGGLFSLGDTLDSSVLWSLNHGSSDVSFGDETRLLSGKGYLEEMIGSCTYRVSPQAFFQTNPHAAPILMQTVQEFAGDVFEKNVLDLYCGSGFFSIPFAKAGSRVMGVELVEEAITDARVNAELNSITADFHVAKVEEMDWRTWKPDVLILDPPRMGMHDRALETILAHAPERIVYVSCNYKNFARELVRLQDLYHVDRMRAIDMFPHTPHVELVTSLIRR